MRKLLTLIIMVCMMSLVACTSSEPTADEKTTTTKKTETSKKEENVTTTKATENKKDEDSSVGKLKMKNLKNYVLGEGITVTDECKEGYEAFTKDGFKFEILLPEEKFIKHVQPGMHITETDGITVDVRISNRYNEYAMTSWTEEERFENGFMYTKEIQRNNKNVYIAEYEIANTDSFCSVYISFNLVYEDEYSDFVKEYITDFEEQLKDNCR